MKTIVIIGGIILAGAALIAVVQNDKKKPGTPAAVEQVQGAENKPAPGAGAPALNPAHGIAGHRCDLPVGAPLANAASGTPAPAPPTPNINMTPAPQPAATAPAGLKLNPAHGVSGHRCDL